MSALAATLREAEPGTRIQLLLKDGAVVSGILLSVNGESVELDDDGELRVDLADVKRLKLEFGSKSGEPPARKAA
jgi:hypothetical protein